MKQDNFQPKIVLNPESGLVSEANLAACQYYGLSAEELVNQPLNDLGHMDLLTGLPNRKLFLDRLQQAVLESLRSDKALAVLFVDLDRFKPVNDTLGHHAGDQVLKLVAERLRHELREEDTLARLGGDEFVVLLKDVQTLSGVERVANQLLKQLSEPFVLIEGEADLGGSIGVAVYPQDAKSAHELLQKSDLAMYRAKKNGRNQWMFFQSEMDLEARQRFEIEQFIRQGIEQDLLEMVFNPVFDTRTHQLYTLEAELNWRQGIINPKYEIEAILNIAGQSYLGLELGKWQVKRALSLLNDITPYHSSLTLMLAVSPVFFRDKNLIEWLDYQITQYHLEPERLVFSLSPDCLSVEMLDVVKRVSELTNLGIQVMVDQFGSQGASLFQIANLDLSGIKMMDFNLSMSLSQISRRNEKLTAALLSFAEQLHPVIIATGILTQEELSFVQSQQCYLAQGLFFGEQITEKKLEESLLQINNKTYYLVNEDEDYDEYE